ncbi:hypothetical protein PROFUN_01116 [Planoprotostelium fungivorum]|uniref:Uncharacterized protein n=1 Tax=Planoprotostelium fungivorum TaxID=1890364 RepID=A0A2P6NCD1_9EUKA|nr:hypothetical protein PROFUN_01116 [Planoprotostelium fungivorum]
MKSLPYTNVKSLPPFSLGCLFVYASFIETQVIRQSQGPFVELKILRDVLVGKEVEMRQILGLFCGRDSG